MVNIKIKGKSVSVSTGSRHPRYSYSSTEAHRGRGLGTGAKIAIAVGVVAAIGVGAYVAYTQLIAFRMTINGKSGFLGQAVNITNNQNQTITWGFAGCKPGDQVQPYWCDASGASSVTSTSYAGASATADSSGNATVQSTVSGWADGNGHMIGYNVTQNKYTNVIAVNVTG
jgi:hypothetical protein